MNAYEKKLEQQRQRAIDSVNRYNASKAAPQIDAAEERMEAEEREWNEERYGKAAPEIEQQDPRAIAVARDPNLWPRWPVLCLKRRTAMDSRDLNAGLGLLWDPTQLDPPEFRVYERNLLDSTPLTECKCTTYADLDAVFADGWLVD